MVPHTSLVLPQELIKSNPFPARVLATFHEDYRPMANTHQLFKEFLFM